MAGPTLIYLSDSSFSENTVNVTPQILDSNVTFSDGDDDFNGGVLTVSGLLAEDIVSVRNQGSGAGQIGFNSGTGEVSYGGVVIGVLSGGVGGTLTIIFDEDATAAAIEALIENLTYANTSDTPTATRNLTITVTDAAGDATVAQFSRLTGANDPFNGVFVGNESKPVFVDLDEDGDLDIVVGDRDSRLWLFVNSGGVFTLATGAADPFSGLNLGSQNAPAFVNLDGDGDLDLVVGSQTGLRAFENDGGAFVELVGGDNPFGGVGGFTRQSPTFGDIDGDGDLDLVVGSQDGVLRAYENDGGTYVQLVGAGNPFDGVDVGYRSMPTLVDLDGDGDVDLVVGSNYGTLRTFENIAGQFTELLGPTNPLEGMTSRRFDDLPRPFSAAGFGDVDGDGDLDFVLGVDVGSIQIFVATGLAPHVTVQVFPEVEVGPPLLSGLDDTAFSENTVNTTPQLIDSSVTFTDSDEDFSGGTLTVSGLLAEDIVSINNQGSGAGQIGFNSGTSEVTYGGVVIGAAVGGVGGTLTVTFDADATAEAIDALLQNLTYANTSDTPTASRALTINVTDAAGNDMSGPLSFSQLSGGTNPFNGIDPGKGSAPAFGDIDGDGDLDMVLGGSTGGTPFFMKYFENTGSAAAPTFVERTGGANPFGGLGVGYYSMPALVDLDGDDDLDLVVGNQLGTFRYFQNTGDETTPTYVELTAGANPFNTFDVGFQSSPAFADLDADGDLDLLAGAFNGQFFYYRNTGTAAAPAFTAQVGAANPLDGVDVVDNASPTLGDIDGDGDFDLVVGAQSGLFFYFENTGTTAAPTYTARTGGSNPLNGADIGGVSAPRLVDLDGDGDLDLVVGEYDGVVNYFRNTTLHGVSVTITVTAQAEPISGSGAGEVLSGTPDGELIEGLGGNDVLKGNDGDDVIDGGDDNDTLVGGNGADDLVGGAGNDDLNGGPGADDMAGGAGDDYYTTDGLDTLTENAGEGNDTVRSSVTFTLGANFENLLLSGSGNLNGTGNGENNTLTGNVGNNILTGLGGSDTINGMGGADTLYGGDNGDTLNGGNDNDVLYGEAGADTLNGGQGNDLLIGGSGDDVMAGGTGDDLYFVYDAGDVVTELANQGTDTVQTDLATYTLGANVENLTGFSAGRQVLNGNSSRNAIQGGAGGDIIDARGDNDRITGGGGNDRMTGGLGADVFVILDSDMINSTVGGTKQADQIQDLDFSQGDRIDLSGIDADINTGGNQAFSIVGAFTGTAGEARVFWISATNVTVLQLDVDGDGVADYQLNLKDGDFTGGAALTGSEPANVGGWVL